VNPAPVHSIDLEQLQALLRCYWRLGTRGKPAESMGRRRSGKPQGLMFVGGMYLLVGLFNGPLVFAGVDVFTYAVIMHSMTLLVVGMASTAESGDILFNASETEVLVHRPIHPRTLLLAKSLNLLALNLFLAGCLNFFPTFFGLATRGAGWWFPFAHVASVALMSVFCCAAVVYLYGLVARFFNREKFDNFAVWTQVAMSLLFAGGYQIMPRLMRRFAGFSLEPYLPYLLPLPPAWCAALDAFGSGTQVSPRLILELIFTGLAVTGALAYSALGKLAPGYGEALAAMGSGRRPKREPGGVRAATGAHMGSLQRWWLRDPIERASFRLAAAYIGRDREVKLRLYPSLGMFFLFPIMGILDRDKEFSAFVPLFTTWMLGTLPVTALETLRTHSQAVAADIFAVTPLTSAAPIFFGARKATLLYLLLPVLSLSALLIAILVPVRWDGILLVLPGVVAIPTVSLIPGCLGQYLPLSQTPRAGGQVTRNTIVLMTTMLTMGFVVATTYIASKLHMLWILVAIELAAILVVHRVLNHLIRSKPFRWE